MEYKTYKLKCSPTESSVGGYVGGKEALLITVFLHLMTEKGRYEIYDAEYGIKRSDLCGKRREYALSMLKRWTREAVTDHYGDEVSVLGYDFSFDDDTLDFMLRLSYNDGAKEKTP